jgi:hypothetical protein
MALANAGCRVEAVCAPGHPLSKTAAVKQIHTYRGLAALRSMEHAIAAAKPDLLISGDDLATRHLHHLHQQQPAGQAGAAVRALIERSLGAPESFPVVYARTAFIQLAQAEGVRAPKTSVICDRDALKKWVAEAGMPTVLKADGTSGGDGVRVVRTLEDAERAFRFLQAPPLMARAVKRALVNQDRTLIWPSLLRHRQTVNGQEFVEGREASSTVACWQGKVLATLHFEVVHKADSAGPATVIRLIEHPEMAAAVEIMARRLNLSGMHGFDFMLEANTGNAYLIEINPRVTQVGHLALGAGRDLPAALCAALSGESLRPARKVTECDLIALFPKEWERDPASTFLRGSAYHDVPWEEPELLRACLGKRKKIGALGSRENWSQVFSAARAPRL